MNAWRDCITKPGSHASVRYGADPKMFSIYLNFVAAPGSSSRSSRAKIAIIGKVRCQESLTQSIIDDGGKYILCGRYDTKGPITITVNFKTGIPVSLDVPAVKSFAYKWMPAGRGDCRGAKAKSET